MSRIELSCGLPPGPDFVDLAVLAEELGYARVWIFGSMSLWEDPVIHLALAARRTSRIGLGTAVLVPSDRAPISMASTIATLTRLSGGRFRPCFGTGFTARMTMGKPAMKLDDLIDHVAILRQLLAGETAIIDGAPTRMLHVAELAAPRPIKAPLWISAFGPRGAERAVEVADGIIGPPHPTLPTATMLSGTVLDPGETSSSPRVLDAVGPWRVLAWHAAYARGGAAAVDSMPGGAAWRAELESLAPAEHRHLLTFEGHATHLATRDVPLLEHADSGGASRTEITGTIDAIRHRVDQLAASGFSEVIYTPSGHDIPRELRAFAQVTP